MKILKICIILLAISIAFSFPISLPGIVTGEEAKNNSIQAYGNDAQAFADALQDKTLANKVIVTSDLENVDISSLQSSLTEGSTLVAMNLSKDNPLVSLPKLQLETNATTNAKDVNPENVQNSIEKTEVDPPYWISVTKYGVPQQMSIFVAANDTEECRQKIISEALKATYTNTLHLPGSTPEAESDESTTGPFASAVLLPDFSTQYWNWVAELDYYLAWNQDDFARAEHTIYQATQYNTATNREYWLVASYFESQFDTYGTTYDWDPYYGFYADVGPEFDSIRNQIDGYIDYDQYLPLMEHGPGNTNPYEEATLGFNLGADSGGGGTISIDYSHTWEVGQNSYDVSANPANAYVSVTENLAGDSRHVNHYSWQTAVFQTVAGSGFEISDLRTTWDMGYTRHYFDLYYFDWIDYQWSAIWNPARLYGPLDTMPTYKYASSLPSYPTNPYTYGTAGVTNQNNILGSTNDGNYAYLYATSTNAMVQFHTALDSQAQAGCVVLQGYVPPNYNSRLLVYVSTDNYNWHQVLDTYVYSTTNYPIDCGYYGGNFNYVMIVAYNSGAQAKIYIDSVRVMP